VKHARAWLLGCVLTLLGTPALADLQLVLQATASTRRSSRPPRPAR
jgi:hypothetical protein